MNEEWNEAIEAAAKVAIKTAKAYVADETDNLVAAQESQKIWAAVRELKK